MTGAGFPHSGISGSSLACQLTGAYRRLLRPSSSPGTKASALCPYLFIHQVARTDANTHAATTTHPYLRCRKILSRGHGQRPVPERWTAECPWTPVLCAPNVQLPLSLRPRTESRTEARDRTLKGGDPAAGSPTATLLRLHPSRRPDRKRFPPKGLGRRFQVQSTPVV